MEIDARLTALAAQLRVCPARRTNTDLTCHNDNESKLLVVVNRGS